MKGPKLTFVSALALLAAAFAAGILARPLISSPKETWLAVEAPPIAARGRAYTIVVRLRRPARGAFLRADLHGQDTSRHYLGFASATAAAKPVPGQAEYRFELPIPPDGDLAYALGVIYLSRDGTWEGRVAAARLDPVPIAQSIPSDEELRPLPVSAYPISDRFEPPREDDFPFQVLAALAWAACALLSLERSPGRASAAMAAACLAACLWELLMPETAISDLFRRASKSEGLYRLRQGPQILVSLAVIAAGFVGACLIILRSKKAGRAARWPAWLCLCAYAGIAILRIISEHAIDALFAVSVAGIQAGQAARLCCAILCAATLAVGAARAAGRRYFFG
jgi:hypothetical protein